MLEMVFFTDLPDLENTQKVAMKPKNKNKYGRASFKNPSLEKLSNMIGNLTWRKYKRVKL